MVWFPDFLSPDNASDSGAFVGKNKKIYINHKIFRQCKTYGCGAEIGNYFAWEAI